MQYRRLGNSGLRVSEVSLGGWLTHGRTLDDQQTERLVRHAFDLGINLFDTADVYHLGAAELALGKAIDGMKREDLVIATKCFFPMSDTPNDRGLSRKHIFESVNQSLKRLKTDYIDLFQFHRFDAETPLHETVRAIGDLVQQGKVLYWGLSQWRAQDIVDAVHLSKQFNCCPPISNQPVYNLLERGIEASVIPTSLQHGLGQIVFSPLAQGVLTGKYKPGEAAPAGSRGADPDSNQFMLGNLNETVLGRVQKLTDFANQAGNSTAQVALAWCLRQSNVASVIVGASRTEQIDDNVGASGIRLSAEDWSRVEEIMSGESVS